MQKNSKDQCLIISRLQKRNELFTVNNNKLNT